MPTLAAQRDAALSKLKLYSAHDTAPVITNDLSAILDAHLRATYWTASTAYVAGDVILPTATNGHRYVCAKAGTSGTTEPIWPIRDASGISDGTGSNAITWIEDGPAYDNPYDVRASIHAAWALKASRASVLFDDDAGKREQVYKHCMEMAEKYAVIHIG
jgi:hypothetical protein